MVFETRPSPEQLAQADQAQLEFRRYFQDLVAHKRRQPGDDLLSALTLARDGENGNDQLTDEEIWMLATLLFGAGFETTANQIGNGLLALLQHPAEMARLRVDANLLRLLPDELIRYDGTAQMTVRVTREPLEIGGVSIPAQETVLVLLGAGNRDPERYPRPDELDVSRSNVRPLTFGGGVHYCPGGGPGQAGAGGRVRPAPGTVFPDRAGRGSPDAGSNHAAGSGVAASDLSVLALTHCCEHGSRQSARLSRRNSSERSQHERTTSSRRLPHHSTSPIRLSKMPKNAIAFYQKASGGRRKNALDHAGREDRPQRASRSAIPG